MSIKRTILVRLLPLACGVLAFGSMALAPARSARVARPAARRQNDTQTKPIVFGDVALSNFRTLSIRLGKTAEVRGPNTTLVFTNPATKTTSTLQAERLMAYADPKNPNQVERVVAEGNLRFTQSRPSPNGNGTMTVRATGTSAEYLKLQGKALIKGPIHFFGEQPTTDGKAMESLDGVSQSATYDENAQQVTFDVRVKGSIKAPSISNDPLEFHGDHATVSMAEQPYSYNITNDEPGNGAIHYVPKGQPKK